MYILYDTYIYIYIYMLLDKWFPPDGPQVQLLPPVHGVALDLAQGSDDTYVYTYIYIYIYIYACIQ